MWYPCTIGLQEKVLTTLPRKRRHAFSTTKIMFYYRIYKTSSNGLQGDMLKKLLLKKWGHMGEIQQIKLCFIPECTEQVATSCKGMCSRHHQENGGTWRGIPKRKLCCIHECTKQIATDCEEMCSRHYQENRGMVKWCSIIGCDTWAQLGCNGMFSRYDQENKMFFFKSILPANPCILCCDLWQRTRIGKMQLQRTLCIKIEPPTKKQKNVMFSTFIIYF